MGIMAIIMMIIEGITLAISEAVAYGVEDIVTAQQTDCIKKKVGNPLNANSILWAAQVDAKRRYDPWGKDKRDGLKYYNNAGNKLAPIIEKYMKQCNVNALGIATVKRGIYKKFDNAWGVNQMNVKIKKIRAYEIKKAKMLAALEAKKGKGKKGDTMEKGGAAVGSIDPKIWMAAGGTLALIIYLRSRKK